MGNFSYQRIREPLFFGYEQLTFHETQRVLIATPEKALTDLLYLYPFYDNTVELAALRLDVEVLAETLNLETVQRHLQKIGSRALGKRMKLLVKHYL